MKTKGLLFLLSGVVFGIVFVIVIPFITVFSLIEGMDDSEWTFRGPGVHQFELDLPGTYTLWNDYKVVRDGRSSVFSARLPSGFQAEIRDVSGQVLPMSGGMSTTVSTGSKESVSIGHFEVESPGVFVVELSGFTEDRNFSVSAGSFGEFMKSFGIAGVSALVGVLGGITLVVIGIVFLVKKPKLPQAPLPPSV